MTTIVLEPAETKATTVDRGHNTFETAQRQFDRVADEFEMIHGGPESKRKRISMRDAAYRIAVNRVLTPAVSAAGCEV